MKEYIIEILKKARGTPVSLEVIGQTCNEMINEGKELFKTFNGIAKNVVIKIPVNPSYNDTSGVYDGIRAIRALHTRGIPINCTLIFTPEQALLAAKAGARFVSPFAGRIDDFIRTNNKKKFEKTDYFPAEGMKKGKKVLEDRGIHSGVDLVAQCSELLKKHKFRTKILAASIRNPQQMREVALAGADIATLPFKVIQKALIHQKTKEGMRSFTADIVPEYKDLLK